MLIFRGSLEKDNSVFIHHKKIQALAIEMFKIHTKTSPQDNTRSFSGKETRKL